MPVKENPTKEVRCPCGIRTVVKVKPATAYCKKTEFTCSCGKKYHIIDYMNGCIIYYLTLTEIV